MSDADHSLDLLIRTKADLAGALAAKKELEHSIIRARFMGKEYASMQTQLDKVNAALAQNGNKNQEAGEGSKIFAGHMGEVKKSIRELSHEFPLAAQALRLLTNPVGGALAIAIGMFAWAKEKIDEWNKSLDETAEILRKSDFAEGIKARKEALEAGEIAMATYADKLAHLIDPEEAFQKRITAEIELLHARNEAQGKVGDANFGLEEAQLKHSQSLQEAALKKQLDDGKISAEAYNQAKLTLDAAYFARLTAMEQEHERAKLAREKQLRDDEIKLQELAAKRAFEAQPELEKKAKEAREKATQTAAKVAHDESDMATAAAAKDANAKAVDDAEKELAAVNSKIKLATAAGALLPGGPGAAVVGGLNLQKRSIEEKLATARGTQEQDLMLGERAASRLKTEKKEAAVDSADASRKEAAAEANKTRINDLNQALLASRDKAAIADAAASKVGSADAQKRFIEERDKNKDASIGGGFTVADEARFEKLRDLMLGSRLNADQFHKFQVAGHDVTDAEMKEFRAQGGRLNDEQQSFMNNFSGYITTQLKFHTTMGTHLAKVTSLQENFVTKLEEQAKINAEVAARLKGVHLR